MALAWSRLVRIGPVAKARRITSFMTMLSAEVLYDRADFKYGTRAAGLRKKGFRISHQGGKIRKAGPLL
jgi:hypothetical protein